MKIHLTPIEDLVLVKVDIFSDERGSFTRLFCEHELSSVIGSRKIVQINHSRTQSIGSVRGMHFQREPYSEMKLVRCLKGKVWDVAVDLRLNSLTYKRWYAHELSPQNEYIMVIPEGFAHGFQVLEEDSELLYLHTAFYNPQFEDGVRYDDPNLCITWPLPVTNISQRDSNYIPIEASILGIVS